MQRLNEHATSAQHDGDDQGITYDIAGGNPGDAFKIGPSNGTVMVHGKLDRESVPVYNLVIRATDAGPLQKHTERVLIVDIISHSHSPI